MPRGEGTGPFGQGPVAGGAVGARGGRGRGAGSAGSCKPFRGTGAPFQTHALPGPDSVMGREEEMELLRSESERLRSILDSIEKRLQELETP